MLLRKIKKLFFAFCVAACAFISFCAFSSERALTIIAEPAIITANGMSSTTLSVTLPSFSFSRAVQWKVLKGSERLTIIEKTPLSMTVQSTLKSGDVIVQARSGKLTKTITLHFTEDDSDADRDGFPDVAELASEQDKDVFRKWLVTVARSQFRGVSPFWEKKNRDCAGLVRFAIQEALKAHDNKALMRYSGLDAYAFPDVKKFNYPGVPLLGKKIFRTKAGEYKKGDVQKGMFSTYVDSRALMELNSRYIGKDAALAKEGDLLFFLHYDDLIMPYHAMIYAGKDERGAAQVVYHTGPVHDTKGRVKLVSLNTLMKYPDARWHPVETNENFLGVYRLNILE